MSHYDYDLRTGALFCTFIISMIILGFSPYYFKIYVYKNMYLKNQECRIKLASKSNSLDYIEKICGQIPKNE